MTKGKSNKNKDVDKNFNLAFKHSPVPGMPPPKPIRGEPYMPAPAPPPKAFGVKPA